MQRSSSWTVQAGSGEEIVRTISGSLLRTWSRKQEEEYPESGSTSDASTKANADDWKLMGELKEGQQQNEKDGAKERKLGLTWTDLTVCIGDTQLLFQPLQH
jgi:hypothetical protein